MPRALSSIHSLLRSRSRSASAGAKFAAALTLLALGATTTPASARTHSSSRRHSVVACSKGATRKASIRECAAQRLARRGRRTSPQAPAPPATPVQVLLPAGTAAGRAPAETSARSPRKTPSGGGGTRETKVTSGRPTELPGESGETLTDPIDSRFLTELPFSARSFWIQPWRAYLDTWPASRLLEAVGVDFPINAALAEDDAQLLQDSGYKLARMGISWHAISYSDPTSFSANHLGNIVTRLTALHKHGLRPLIVLDANSGAPAPLEHVTLETLEAAPAGAQTVKLSETSAALVVPGKTGFNHFAFGGDPDVLISAVSANGVATLSRPLAQALPAGSYGGTTLRFAPFEAPLLASGAPNPAFQETLNGWLDYVAAVGRVASSVVGPGGYDIEVWNELTFGSQFLNAEHYYSNSTPTGSQALTAESTESDIDAEGESDGETEAEAEAEKDSLAAPAEAERETETGSESEIEAESGSTKAAVSAAARAPVVHAQATAPKKLVNRAIRKALLAETVSYIRNPANGFSPEVGISDGFASQTPFISGGNTPVGLTALSKHPYTTVKDFPGVFNFNAGREVNALGASDASSSAKHAPPLFIPTYQSLFPEFWLTGTATETLIRDIAPFSTPIYGNPHGREVGPPGGPPVQKWITEFDMRPHGTVSGPDGITPASGPSAALTSADKEHFQAKVMMRSFVSNVSKGVNREYGGDLGISEAFTTAAEQHPGTYPGDAAGGETMTAVHRLLGQFQGPTLTGPVRQLALDSIAQVGNHAQFAGDGSSAHPSLYDRDVLAVFPFQASPTRFVIPVYVMTRNLLTLYQPSAAPSDVRRFDLPDETFDITLANLPESQSAPRVSAYDPLLNSSTPAKLVSRTGANAVFEVAATDYPRMLSIEYAGA